MDLQLRQYTALVTGASTGIGAGIAKALAAEGVRVAITARRGDKLERLASDIAAQGHPRPLVITGDIASATEIGRIANEATRALGRVDILVNTAGGSRPTTVDASDDAWSEAFTLNFASTRRMTQALLPGMRERRWGRIINFSGTMEPRDVNAAGAAKAAVQFWAKGMATRLAVEGITVNTIAPGRINSEQILEKLHPSPESREAFIARHIPIGYFGEPADIAHLVSYLVSPLARYLTGEVIAVDGGMHAFAH
ncbi:3-oxoacyl-[acyl-carrier protein] reductase [Pseudomonas flavescens]|uniref:3-oxoacyl-[acyl-carrier protein] reductase n=1 Tax=Phytopseudomonas flavescens TaxID=29435 RepID=A0A1G8PW84_9GAMM|nr:SDR family oxidoreductase [Pseudomonas flavescens]SDI96526.1 3-oxoacyl-[acyl-carrier protein] reductase [Pseudomonas flavescens]